MKAQRLIDHYNEEVGGKAIHRPFGANKATAPGAYLTALGKKQKKETDLAAASFVKGNTSSSFIKENTVFIQGNTSSSSSSVAGSLGSSSAVAKKQP